MALEENVMTLMSNGKGCMHMDYNKENLSRNFDWFSRNDSKRFWCKVDVQEGKFWNWLGSEASKGRAQGRLEGVVMPAARIMWLLTYGEIPTSREGSTSHVLHTCDNPL